jgi:hypothetical protein
VRPDVVVGLLAEPARLRVYAAVVLGAGTPSEVTARTGLPHREVVAALRRLERGGLISAADRRLVARVEVFKDSVREYAPVAPPEEPLDLDRQKAAVLRAFVVDGRLSRIPAARGKRRIVLEHIAASFEPGVKYPERTVDAILRAWHDDHASLRRYLVDEELLAREHAMYWRVGGPVDVTQPAPQPNVISSAAT